MEIKGIYVSLFIISIPSKSYEIFFKDWKIIPKKHYFSFFRTFSINKCFPITNVLGELLSSDRQHSTFAGIE